MNKTTEGLREAQAFTINKTSEMTGIPAIDIRYGLVEIGIAALVGHKNGNAPSIAEAVANSPALDKVAEVLAAAWNAGERPAEEHDEQGTGEPGATEGTYGTLNDGDPANT